jgi:formamidopyrimidine-DNA glycosylase
MPELPEIECVRRTVAPFVVGATITGVTVRRTDIVDASALGVGKRRRRGRPSPARAARRGAESPELRAALLVDRRIVALVRRGKQLAMQAENDHWLVIQLGMSGQWFVEVDDEVTEPDDHRHIEWSARAKRGRSVRLVFRDPRRFGGLTALPSMAALHERWTTLGPDALEAPVEQLAAALATSRRQAKSALLDQAVIAGVGNIYADEALFRAGVRPTQSLARAGSDAIDRLSQAVREVITEAVSAGGSTLRDYVDGERRSGEYQDRHAVYGRSGLDCVACATPLRAARNAGRQTVWCPRCQRLIHKPRTRYSRGR